MTMAQDLIVVGFKGTQRASEVLSELRKLDENWTLDLEDAVSAYRTDDGQLRIDQSVAPTRGQGADLGAFVGTMLGAIIAAPLTGGLSAAAAAATVGAGAAGMGLAGAGMGAQDATDFKERYGISDDFVDQVARVINPGESAVFVLMRTGQPDVVIEKFRGYGGRILRTNLTLPQAARVQREMRG
jgi:uncharacterized membrane protein